MRIAYPMRVDAFDKPGGDLIVVQESIKAGGNSGVGDIPMFHGEIITDLDADLSGFDLVHLTNIDRPVETYHYYRAARVAGKPFVISPIHHSYLEIGRYERDGRGGVVGIISGRLGFRSLEYLRCIVRSVTYPQLLWPTIVLATRGMRNAQAIVLEGASMVLVLTNKEREDIVEDIGYAPKASWLIVRNGFENTLPVNSVGRDERRDLEVCVVGRIEARKNQIRILKALNNLGISGIFLGQENTNHASYCSNFKKLVAQSTSKYISFVPHDEIIKIMRRAKVHVSASWFEVSSLVDLEAYLCGCQVVSSRCGGTREIIGEYAEYVDPNSSADIERGIVAALRRSGSSVGGNINDGRVESWVSIAGKLAALYRQAINEARMAPKV